MHHSFGGDGITLCNANITNEQTRSNPRPPTNVFIELTSKSQRRLSLLFDEDGFNI